MTSTSALNSIVPELTIPSTKDWMCRGDSGSPNHFGRLKSPTTLMHVHVIFAKLKKKTTKEEVIKVFQKTPRVKLISGVDGFLSTAHIMDFGRIRHPLGPGAMT